MEKETTSTLSDEQRVKELEKELLQAQTELDGLHAELLDLRPDEENRSLITVSESDMKDTLFDTELLRNIITKWLGDTELSEADRRRLFGSGVRRYGFLDKVSDIMETNPKFTPSFLNEANFKKLIRRLEVARNINVVLQQTVRASSDVMLILGDEAFRSALMYYGAVRDASIRRVPGARELFLILQQFFRRPRPTEEEPTEEETLRDAKALLHGKKDGKIVIEHQRPHLEGGQHVVVDQIHEEKFNEKLKIEK